MIRNRTDRLFGMRALNVALLGAGILAIAAGYVLLDGGSTVAAPLLLTLGYVGLIPAGLLSGLRSPGLPDADEGE